LPFNLDDEVKKIDPTRFQERPGGRDKKPYGGPKPPAKGDEKWNRQAKGGLEDEEEEIDPDWIEFDPEKNREKFFGHVMEDEQKLREKVVHKKEQKVARAEERKQKAIHQAKLEKMTVEQRDIIAESKKTDISNIDQDKLKEAEKLAAQIEQESYSKFDEAFEHRAKRNEDTLTDE